MVDGHRHREGRRGVQRPPRRVTGNLATPRRCCRSRRSSTRCEPNWPDRIRRGDAPHDPGEDVGLEALVAVEAEDPPLANGRVYQNRYVFVIEVGDTGIRQVREYCDTLHIVDATGAVKPSASTKGDPCHHSSSAASPVSKPTSEPSCGISDWHAISQEIV